jgi:hypothetical protein
MNEEWLGSWWRAGTDTRVGGQLVLDEHGIKLTLFGSFFDWSGFDLTGGVGFPLDSPQTAPVIHGRTIKPISVLNATCDFPVPPGAEGFERWHADCIVEAHVDEPTDESELSFDGLRLDLQTLPAWSRARGVGQRIWFNERRTEVIVEPHDLASAVLDTGERISISQAAITRHGTREYEIRQPVTIAIEGTEPATWTELLNRWLQPLQVLLWLATAVPGRVETMELLLPQGDEPIPRWGRLWAPLLEPGSSAGRDLYPNDVLFFAGDLPGGFGAGLERWLSMWGELQHVLGPLYARAAAPFAYANDRFYTAIAAVEAYHRYCVESERDLPRVEHRQRVTRIDDLLSEHAPELREWAVNAVRPFNRLPLWRRIVDIAETLPDFRASLFGDRTEAFSRAVESSRHGHAHALPGSGQLDSGHSLYVAADALVWMLRTCIMVDLGISLDQSQERVCRHERFRWTARELAVVLDEIT